MAFDIKKTIDLVIGGLTSPAETWDSYLGENPTWQQTLVVLTAPLILANVILSLLLSRIMGTMSPVGLSGGWLSALVLSLVMACIGFAVAAMVFNFLAGVFGGKADFSRAFAALSLAAIPAWIAGIVGSAVPWVGWLIALAGGILTLVFLYRIVPLALAVPDNKRVLHFVASLVVALIINIVVANLLLGGRIHPEVSRYDVGQSSVDGSGVVVTDRGPGVFGEIGRQAEIIASASEDRYDPPADGMVTRDQAEWVAGVADKSRQAYEEEMSRLKKLSDELDDRDNPSPADIAKMYQGMGSAMSLNTLEMEVVDSGGGNWAEYQWVKDQLRKARLQRGEGSDALVYNFKLYQEFEDRLQGHP